MLRQLLYELIKASGAIFVAALVTLAQHLFNIDDIDTSLFIIYSILIMIYFDVNRGNKKGNLFDTQPPCRVWVSSSRLKCGFNGNFDGPSSAVDYAWYVWVKGYKGETVIKWFN